jgi:hypothetical protein
MSVDLAAVHEVVAGCEQHLQASALKQDVTMRGVQLLCGVVADSLGQNDSAAKTRLLEFVAAHTAETSAPAALHALAPLRRSTSAGPSAAAAAEGTRDAQRAERRLSARKRRASASQAAASGLGSPLSPRRQLLGSPLTAAARDRSASDLTASPSDSPEAAEATRAAAKAAAGRAAYARHCAETSASDREETKGRKSSRGKSEALASKKKLRPQPGYQSGADDAAAESVRAFMQRTHNKMRGIL